MVQRMRALEVNGPGLSDAGTRIDFGSTIARQELATLDNELDVFLAAASAELGRSVEPVYRYSHALMGFAARLNGQEARLQARHRLCSRRRVRR